MSRLDWSDIRIAEGIEILEEAIGANETSDLVRAPHSVYGLDLEYLLEELIEREETTPPQKEKTMPPLDFTSDELNTIRRALDRAAKKHRQRAEMAMAHANDCEHSPGCREGALRSAEWQTLQANDVSFLAIRVADACIEASKTEKAVSDALDKAPAVPAIAKQPVKH